MITSKLREKYWRSARKGKLGKVGVRRCRNSGKLPRKLMHCLAARGLLPGANAGIMTLCGCEVMCWFWVLWCTLVAGIIHLGHTKYNFKSEGCWGIVYVGNLV